ncbi:winged helix family two component transcriptional regulator [Methylophaga lonarensis MPL]|uniref:Winged helix family two component transcriptional regulator n=1 Tax=Methylophaga lonarensis MPL TaxID=1286106 RepID=M7P094_9GAMM|nr:response regulator transcription factor [Methylophaga lonarensis]EMR12886.1 winged helix family two component transcriptional regulator [Methylophaga lonarensis MPL]
MNKQTPRLAVVEDDPEQRETLQAWLELNDYSVWSVGSAESFYKMAAVDPVDILIIDLGLPGEDGTATIEHLRKYSDVGIIVVSARSRAYDRVQAIQCGADIFLVKPVIPEELVSCIESLWRRIQSSTGVTTQSKSMDEQSQDTDEVWRLMGSQRQLISPNDIAVKLTPSELAIMTALARAQGPLSRHDIIIALGANPKSFQMNRIDVHLSRLRSKVNNSCQMSIPISLLPGSRLEFHGKILLL